MSNANRKLMVAGDLRHRDGASREKRRKNTIAISTALVFLVLLLAGGIAWYARAHRKMTGNEFFGEQNVIMNTLTDYMRQMDKVYALYISGGMTDNDFIQQHDNLAYAYSVIQADYEKYLGENPVRTGSHSYISMRGVNSITALREDIQALLDSTVANGKPLEREEMTYAYMAYQERINDDLCEYAVAFRWLVEGEGVKADVDEMLGILRDYQESTMPAGVTEGTDETAQ